MKYLHSMIRVTDLDAALDFFCGGLGLVEISRNEYPDGQFTLCFLAAAEDVAAAKQHRAPLLELTFNWDGQAVDNGRNFGHLAFQVEDIYRICRQLQERGVAINRPPRDGRMAFVKSPDNISVELLQAGESKPITEPWASMPNLGEW